MLDNAFTDAASGSLSDRAAVEILCQMASALASGKVEFSDGRKRWVFYLQEGRVMMTQSNLRSEQLKTLRATAPDADGPALLQLQLTVRVLSATELADGTWSLEPGVDPPKQRPSDLMTACWQAALRKLPEHRVAALLAPQMSEFPVLVSGEGMRLSELPLDGPLRNMLSELDGQRTLQEVLDFAPLDAREARRGLVFCLLTGAVAFREAARGSAVRAIAHAGAADEERALLSEMMTSGQGGTLGVGVSAPRRPAGGDGAGDMGSFIASQLGERPRSPDTDEAPASPGGDPDLRNLHQRLVKVQDAETEFDVLGVPWDASDDEYRNAYFQLARELHPDRWSTHSADHGDAADQLFKRISAAWEILGDPASRQKYIDRVIHGVKTEDELAMEQVQVILAAEGDFKEGLKHFRAGRLTQAHEIFKSCTDRVPETQEFAAYYGYTLYKLNVGKDEDMAERGMAIIRQAIEKAPKLADAWVLLGQLYLSRDEPLPARKCFVQALKLNPSHPDAYREMKRLTAAREKEKKGGWFSNLFKGKKRDK